MAKDSIHRMIGLGWARGRCWREQMSWEWWREVVESFASGCGSYFVCHKHSLSRILNSIARFLKRKLKRKKIQKQISFYLSLCPQSLHTQEKSNRAVQFLLVPYHGDGFHRIFSPDSPLQESPNLIDFYQGSLQGWNILFPRLRQWRETEAENTMQLQRIN